MARVDGYIRVSKVGGRAGDSFQSPAEQRRQIEAWAKAEGYEIGEVFEELDESGGRADRPMLLAAIERAEQGQTDGIVVAKLDRFFRSQIHGLQAAQRLKDAGRFLASTDGVDTRDQRQALNFGIRLAIAEDERERRRQDFDNALRGAVERGVHRCPVAPFGYRKRPDKILEPDPALAPIVSELYERAARGESWADLGRWLENRNIISPYGGVTWPGRSVRMLLSKRVYLGEASNGEHVNPHAHPPLTDSLTWRQAIKARRVASPPRSDEPALLSGLIRCAGCRYSMQSYRRGDARGYKCRKKYAAGECQAPAAIAGSVIEPFIERMLFAHVGSVQPSMPENRDVELEAAVKQAEADLVAFRDNPALLRSLDPEDFAAGVKVRREAFIEAQDKLIAHGRSITPRIDVVELEAIWPALTVAEKREILVSVFGAIFVLRGRSKHGAVEDFTRVFARGSEPRDLPRRGFQRGQDLRPLGDDAAEDALNIPTG